MPKRRRQPSQTWRTFLTNHVLDLLSTDSLTVRTVRLRVLFVLFVLAHYRRRVLPFNVTDHPTARGSLSRSCIPPPTTPPLLISFAIAMRSTGTSSANV